MNSALSTVAFRLLLASIMCIIFSCCLFTTISFTHTNIHAYTHIYALMRIYLYLSLVSCMTHNVNTHRLALVVFDILIVTHSVHSTFIYCHHFHLPLSLGIHHHQYYNHNHQHHHHHHHHYQQDHHRC